MKSLRVLLYVRSSVSPYDSSQYLPTKKRPKGRSFVGADERTTPYNVVACSKNISLHVLLVFEARLRRTVLAPPIHHKSPEIGAFMMVRMRGLLRIICRRSRSKLLREPLFNEPGLRPKVLALTHPYLKPRGCGALSMVRMRGLEPPRGCPH